MNRNSSGSMFSRILITFLVASASAFVNDSRLPIFANSRYGSVSVVVDFSRLLFSPVRVVKVRSTSTIAEDEVATAGRRISIAKPEIHWTVPGFKVGWQDEEGNWFDENGPRDGPPQNYWRQSADEREYGRDMDAVDAIMKGYDNEAIVADLEHRNSSRRPSMSRKVLGRWAPLMISNKLIAYNDKPSNDEGEIEVPFMLHISRSFGRRFGPKNHYGVFDLNLEEGEHIDFRATGAGVDLFSKQVTVSGDVDSSLEIGLFTSKVKLQFGKVTYISDYLMIQRGLENEIDLFLRNDKAYLGATPHEMEKYHLI